MQVRNAAGSADQSQRCEKTVLSRYRSRPSESALRPDNEDMRDIHDTRPEHTEMAAILR